MAHISTVFSHVRRLWMYLSERPLIAAAIIGLAPLSICIFMAILNPPVPVVHDEFSYLLAADTFMHGRLANPTHPLWIFFETFHVNHQPAYVSKYPPMQGFALAFGRLITGQAIVGVWISLAAACVAVYWMLRGWLMPSWAFAGGLLVALNGKIITHWGLTFWGGAMAMLGGALLYGAIPRLVDKPRSRDAVLCGIGIGILAMSRPYEGLVASIPAAGYLLYGLYHNKELNFKRLVYTVFLPVGLILMLTVGFMGYYNYRTTGDVFKFAYKVNAETYDQTPKFFFMDIGTIPEYRYNVMKRFYIDFELARYMSVQSLPGLINNEVRNFKRYWSFFLPSLLSIFVLGLPFALRERRFQFVFFCCLFFGFALFFVMPSWTHYAAPFTAVIVLAIVGGLRSLWNWKPGGKGFGVVILIPVLVFSIVRSYSAASKEVMYRDLFPVRHQGMLEQDLKKQGEKHLVFVRYQKNHNVHGEWVYNSAEIDDQAVVWARYMNPKENRALIDYYKDRQVWLLVPETTKLILARYQQ